MSTDLIVFDLDGTLVDSASQIAQVLNEMRNARGLEPLPLQSYRALVSHGADNLIKKSLCLEDVDLSQNLESFRALLIERPVGPEALFPGVLESLQLIEKSMVKIAICSNKPGNLCRKILRDLKIDRFFTAVIGGGDSAEDKPSPAPLKKAIAQSDSSIDSTVFVGDSTVDQLTAKNLNVKFAFFAAGYDDGVAADQAYFLSSSIYELTKKILHGREEINGTR